MYQNRVFRVNVITAILTCHVCAILADNTSTLSKEEIIRAWEANYCGMIKNIEATSSYNLIKENFAELDRSTLPDYLNPERVIRKMSMHRRTDCRSNRYYAMITAGSLTRFADRENEYAFDGRNTTIYRPSEKTGVIREGLCDIAAEDNDYLRSFMLMDTVDLKANRSLYPNGTPRFIYHFNSPQSEVSKETILVGGELCHCLIRTINNPHLKEPLVWKVWIAGDKGMLPMKFEDYSGDTLQKAIEVKEIGVDKTAVGSVWYPKRAIMTENSKFFGITEHELIVHSMKVNVTENQDTYRVKFPIGIEIFDMVQNSQYRLEGKSVNEGPGS